jgi:hypothetical protein
MSHFMHGFNIVMREFQWIMDLIMGSLIDDIEDRLKEVVDTLNFVMQQLKDQEDNIAMLK